MKTTLTALVCFGFLMTVVGLAALMHVAPLGFVVWAGGMGLVGYVTVDVVGQIWNLDREDLADDLN